MRKIILAFSFCMIFIANFALAAGPGSGTPVEFENPLGVNSVESFLANVMANLESVFITIAIIVILIGGIMYMFSFGNEQAMERAKKVLLGAVIGLAIAISARTFLQTIWNILGVSSTNMPSPGGQTFEQIAGRILTFLLSITGIVAIISLIIGGIMYLTSFGDEDRIQKGKKIVTASIIGIIVSLGAVVIVKQIEQWLG